MRVLIRCAGSGDRWNDYLGVPKHLAPICGEPLLERTVRLTLATAPDADIAIIVPPDITADTLDRYQIDGARVLLDDPSPDAGDVDKVWSSLDLWDPYDPTVVLFGDVWWHADTLADILTQPVDDWHTWLRIAGDGGELFAFKFAPSARPAVDAACASVADLHRAGQLDHGGAANGPIPGGWALYRHLSGRPVTDHADHGHATHVTDGWTDDFDLPADWDQWCLRWARTDPADRPPKHPTA